MSTGFVLRTKNSLKYLTIPAFEQTGLVAHAFSTRQGGVSEGDCKSLNLGTHVSDDLQRVVENRKIFLSALGLDIKDMVAAQQVHGKRVHYVTQADVGRGALANETALPDTDALITDQKGIVLTSYYADCVPLYVLDPVRKAIGLAHAGWKGTVIKIGLATIQAMEAQFGTNPKDCLVAIGPSIGHCCYEVDERVLAEFKANFKNYANLVSKELSGKAQLNLWEANREVFREAGVPEENITSAEVCTSCHHDLLFSYRKEGGKTGRLASVMALK